MIKVMAAFRLSFPHCETQRHFIFPAFYPGIFANDRTPVRLQGQFSIQLWHSLLHAFMYFFRHFIGILLPSVSSPEKESSLPYLASSAPLTSIFGVGEDLLLVTLEEKLRKGDALRPCPPASGLARQPPQGLDSMHKMSPVCTAQQSYLFCK
jgi:hypothetical protein